MKHSILELNDIELQEQFGEECNLIELTANAQRYKAELVRILGSNEKHSLRPLLHKFFQIESRLHKGKIWLAFGDEKGARYQFERIEEESNEYNEAQYQLLRMHLGSKDIHDLITYAENIDNTSAFHGAACILIGELFYKDGKKQKALEWYLRVDEEFSPDYKMASGLISQVSQEIDEISLGEGRLNLKPGYPFNLVDLYLDHILHISGVRDGYREQIPHVISLSQNENGMQEGKLSFLAIPFSQIDGDQDGSYHQLYELDHNTDGQDVIFEGISKSGRLVFKSERSGETWDIDLNIAQKSLRLKDDSLEADTHEETLAWEEGRSRVIIVSYGVEHPTILLKRGLESLQYYDYEAALLDWGKIPEGAKEYDDAQHDIAEIHLTRFRNQHDIEHLLLAGKHIKNVKTYSELRGEIEEEYRKHELPFEE